MALDRMEVATGNLPLPPPLLVCFRLKQQGEETPQPARSLLSSGSRRRAGTHSFLLVLGSLGSPRLPALLTGLREPGTDSGGIFLNVFL